MKRPMTRAEVQAWQARWQLVNRAQCEELRGRSVDQKFHQLAALMASARALSWTLTREAETAEVRRRWAKLRKAYGV
jgi:hypothetical protein